ncbi:MAG TPA: hypothetical protein VJN96_23020 [Vicinamibacterales bacterium]|nr:hypothetical protein [Vicinamibacterales bacterium]
MRSAIAFLVGIMLMSSGELLARQQARLDFSGRWLRVDGGSQALAEDHDLGQLFGDTVTVDDQGSTVTVGALTVALNGPATTLPSGRTIRGRRASNEVRLTTTSSDDKAVPVSGSVDGQPVRLTYDVAFVLHLDSPGVLVVRETHTFVEASARLSFRPAPQTYTTRFLRAQSHPNFAGTWERVRRTANFICNCVGPELFDQTLVMKQTDGAIQISWMTFDVGGVARTEGTLTTTGTLKENRLEIVTSSLASLAIGSLTGVPVRAKQERRYTLQVLSDESLVVQDWSGYVEIEPAGLEINSRALSPTMQVSWYRRSKTVPPISREVPARNGGN